jgi:pimeloyl-ACP methyl ester carboxylesterase
MASVPLHFQSFGSGPPLLILHGLLGSLDNWVSLARRWGDSFQVFALDLRNHGRSPHAEDFNYQVMAGDVLTFLDSQQFPKAHLLGHSMGGKVAMRLALDNPERVEKLVVADMAPKSYPPWHRPIIDAMGSLRLNTFQTRGDADAALAPAIPDAPTRQFLLKNLARDEQGGFRWKVNLDSISRHYDELNAPIPAGHPFAGPALFIHGGRSEYVLESDRPAILRDFPQACFVAIPDAGHWLHADAPEAFLRAVGEFLR